jgi:hypothetical protein
MSLASTGEAPEPTDARTAMLTLLTRRAPSATLCPSEVARVIAQAAGRTDWRPEMAGVHAAVDALVAQGVVRLSWKGSELSARAGPYRIGYRSGEPQG